LFPLRREEELVVRHLPEETLVYDLRRHKAHCLNQAAALVWRHCDGQTSAAEMALRLHHELGMPAEERVVWLALDRLRRAGLLTSPLPAGRPRCSRRELAQLGIAALAAPLVLTIIAPTAAMAASCVPRGNPCSTVLHCCPGLKCTPSGKCEG
jgi:hypothetical protein